MENTSAYELIELRFRLHLYKSKYYLILENAKNSKKEIKNALEIYQKELKHISEKKSNMEDRVCPS